MKHENKKDKALAELFDACAEGGETPPESVTFAAKAALGENRERVKEKVAESAAAGSSGSGGSVGFFKRIPPAVYYSVAAAFIVIAVVLLFVLLPMRTDRAGTLGNSDTADNEPPSSDMLVRDDGAAFDGAVFPFVAKDGVSVYAEYILASASGGFAAGEVVAYYTEFVYSGMSVAVYAEEQELDCFAGEFFLSLTESYISSGLDFSVGADGGTSLAGFCENGLAYCVGIQSAESVSVYPLLDYIATSFS